MAKFKLLAGQHIGPDPKAESIPRDGVDEKFWRRPSRTYNVGQMIESDADLVVKFGADKFAFVSGTPKKGTTPANAPAPTDKRLVEPTPEGDEPLHPDSTTDEIKERQRANRAAIRGDEHGVTPGGDDDVESDADETDNETAEPADYDAMTVADLKEHAAANDVDLAGAHVKADIVAAIKKADRKAARAGRR